MNERPTKGIAVDGGCLGNPGKAEYRGVDLETGEIVFEYKITGLSTNNIAEFLAIVHGLIYSQKNNINHPVYSDSTCALAWTKKRRCNTNFTVTDQTQSDLIKRAEDWLRSQPRNSYKTLFWSNKTFGETPADFGRKGKPTQTKGGWYDIISETQGLDDRETLVYLIKNYNAPSKKK